MSKKDYYEILGVSKNNSVDEIKKAYKKLALKFHPDRAPEDKKKEYEEKFKEMSEAYAVLSDPKKKQQYDQFGHDQFEGHYSQEDIFRGSDLSSIFEELFGRSGFGGFSGFGSGRKKRKGNDLQYDLIISFEESVKGVEKKLEFKKNVTCKKCSGTGAKNEELKKCDKCNGQGRISISGRTIFGIINQVVQCDECHGKGEIPKVKCSECNGKGVVKKKVVVQVNIPEGVDNGNVLIVSGKGEEISEGVSGDLQVVIRVTPHKLFHREGDDLHLIVPIRFSQAVMGDKIKIPTPYGSTNIKISSGFESGTVMRLKGKGMENVNLSGKGDLYVKIKIETPKKISKKQKKLLEEFDLG